VGRRFDPDGAYDNLVGISALGSAVVVSGDATNGTFRQTLVVSDWAPPGRYSLLVGVRDTVDNRVFFQTEYFITVTE
jgi:hypothetical protein